MKQWVLSAAGIAILAVLADIILPDGKTRKYIKTVIGVVITLVLIQPILNLVRSDFTDFAQKDYVLQEDYLQYVSSEGDSYKLQNLLKSGGFKSPTVTYDVSSNTYTAVFTENYDDDLLTKATAIATVANCNCVFVWNNTE